MNYIKTKVCYYIIHLINVFNHKFNFIKFKYPYRIECSIIDLPITLPDIVIEYPQLSETPPLIKDFENNFDVIDKVRKVQDDSMSISLETINLSSKSSRSSLDSYDKIEYDDLV